MCRKDTAALKVMKHQIENESEEAQKRRQQLTDWIAAERTKTEQYCTEQRSSIAREKRNALKEVIDMKFSFK